MPLLIVYGLCLLSISVSEPFFLLRLSLCIFSLSYIAIVCSEKHTGSQSTKKCLVLLELETTECDEPLKHCYEGKDKEEILELVSENESKTRISPFCILDSGVPDYK